MGFSKRIKRNLNSHYTDNLVEEFYEPLLAEADTYQRVSGYLTTKGIDLYLDGIEELANNNGKMEFIISKTISKNDYDKIKKGYNLLEQLKPLKISKRNEILNSDMQSQLGNLAFMIAMGKARIKIGFTDKGIFHDKFGIIKSSNEKVFFAGSANETLSGIDLNYESISVDVSWDTSQKVQSRIEANSKRFERLWNNKEPGVTVVEISSVAYEEIAVYQSKSSIKNKGYAHRDLETDLVEKDSISFKLIKNKIIRFDKTNIELTKNDRKLNSSSDLKYFFEDDNSTVKAGTNYKNIERIINVTKNRAKRKEIKVYVSEAVWEFIARNKYSIEQYRILGSVYKKELKKFPNEKVVDYKEFSKIVQNEVSRPLYELHLKAAYYEYEMARSANFSVPGSGKTAMVLGVFAYLNRKATPKNEKINKILVVSPISAFESWKEEFVKVFGKKKVLRSIDSQSSKNFTDDLQLNWKISNLILINYESLPKYENLLEKLIDSKTMLVYDEVHRVKNPNGVRAKAALNISRMPKFKYVLTGTPIPNSYKDVYNFLHILYPDEYTSFFGWGVKYLESPRVRQIQEINRKLYPFFWRTNKNDLEVPEPESDILKVVEATSEQLNLAQAIYENEKSSLARLIRLIQASTNPSLLKADIDYDELMSYDEEGNISNIDKKEFNKILKKENYKFKEDSYSDFNLDSMTTPKFIEGIKLIEKLVSKKKKVLVWGIFVNTLHKITRTLLEKGIKVNLIYGGTDKSERLGLLDQFRNGDIQVLVTNPQTLGEAISLHREVHDAVYFEYNFNLTFMLQSRDRIHRLGLKPNDYTRYYYIQTKDEGLLSSKAGFIDQKIYSRLKDKEQIMYGAIDNDELSIEYSENEIEEAIKIIDEERMRINTNR